MGKKSVGWGDFSLIIKLRGLSLSLSPILQLSPKGLIAIAASITSVSWKNRRASQKEKWSVLYHLNSDGCMHASNNELTQVNDNEYSIGSKNPIFQGSKIFECCSGFRCLTNLASGFVRPISTTRTYIVILGVFLFAWYLCPGIYYLIIYL